jgi:hypothetical protein
VRHLQPRLAVVLASTYYEAVHVFGRTNVVTQADLDRAAELKQDSLDR